MSLSISLMPCSSLLIYAVWQIWQPIHSMLYSIWCLCFQLVPYSLKLGLKYLGLLPEMLLNSSRYSKMRLLSNLKKKKAQIFINIFFPFEEQSLLSIMETASAIEPCTQVTLIK